MNDLELLKLAAQALGLPLCEEWDCAADGKGILIGHGDGDLRPWNPLAVYGETLCLAVGLQIQVTPGTYNKDEFTAYSPAGVEAKEYWSTQQSELEATCRAIVRVAAETERLKQDPL